MTDRPTLADLDAEPDGTPWCCNGNAEDCALCTDPNPPYPWTCPGHPDTEDNRERVHAAEHAGHGSPCETHLTGACAQPHGKPAPADLQQRLANTLREILARFEPAYPSPDQPMRHQATVSIEDYQRWRNTLQPAPAHNAGPSVAECAANDRKWPLEKEGE